MNPKTTVLEQAIFKITDFGARGDGATKDTASIQAAIDACHAHGNGIVVVPRGVFHTGPLYLRSNVHLHLEKESVLLGSASPDDYPDWESPKMNYHFAAYNSKYLLLAEDEENISITGQGTINGQGVAHYEDSGGNGWWRVIDKKTRPGRMILFALCRNVLIEGITCEDSPAWTFWVVGCETVRFRHVTINTDYRAINTDGIDIDNCRDVSISHCRIRTGDDSIVLRAIDRVFKPESDIERTSRTGLGFAARPCEQVTVENCTLAANCNAVRISYIGDGVIRNATFRNLAISESRRGIICQVPTSRQTPEKKPQPWHTPGPVVENLHFSNITIDANQPIWFFLADEGSAQRIGNISFENLRITGNTPSVIKGNDKTALKNVSLRNIHFTIAEEGPRLTHSMDELTGEAAVLNLSRCHNVVLQNISVEGASAAAGPATPLLHLDRVEGLHLAEFGNRTASPVANQ